MMSITMKISEIHAKMTRSLDLSCLPLTTSRAVWTGHGHVLAGALGSVLAMVVELSLSGA